MRTRNFIVLCCKLLIKVNHKLFSGAGYHSDALKKEYQKTCFLACRKAAEALQQGGNAVDAVEKAIIGLYFVLIFRCVSKRV